MYRIASDQPVATQFVDNGLPKQLITPADPNFDHANFYWRMELQGETAATIQGATTIGNDSLQMTPNRYRSAVVRITRGRGAGQERTITANTDKALTVAPAWDVHPDASSCWVVAEAGWQFGALSKTPPVQFEVPNRGGETVEIMGKAANVNDIECAGELSTVTRWQIEGSGVSDSDVPPAPHFGLGLAKQEGGVELSGVSFTDLTNTRTISSATLTLHYWDELSGRPSVGLAAAIAAGDASIALTAAGDAAVGSLVQIDGEVMRVEELQNNGAQYRVTRGMHGSAAVTHNAQATVYPLASKPAIAPFPPDFFGSPYSGSWSYTVALPDVRVASAELFVTNVKGNSPVASICVKDSVDNGLRTLSGGQYSIQVDGFLAVEQHAAPALVVDAPHAVRDVFAILSTAADAPVSLQLDVDGTAWCGLTIPAGSLVSAAVDGSTLGTLTAKSKMTMSVLSVGQTYPGTDLTVVVRL
jgi:hypothetical protein